jgi:HSP20 family protein
MERLLAQVAQTSGWALSGEYPPVNITRGDAITLEALCPGVDRQSLDVSVVGDAVTIRGERKSEPAPDSVRYHVRERPIGAFTRTLRLGERLNADQTQATYTNGILRVQLTRAAEATPKKIPIQTGS